MSSPGVFVDNPDKAWANFYLNTLKVYNGFTFGGSVSAANIISIEYYTDVVRINNNAPVDQADVDINYYGTVTTYEDDTQHTKIVFEFGQDIQGQNGANGITSQPIVEALRPPADTFAHAHVLIHDNQGDPGNIVSGSVYLADGTLLIKALPDTDITVGANAFSDGGVPAKIGPVGPVIIEF